jgi:hypothetical protein
LRRASPHPALIAGGGGWLAPLCRRFVPRLVLRLVLRLVPRFVPRLLLQHLLDLAKNVVALFTRETLQAQLDPIISV